jgi:hypothetical protein
MQMRNTLGGLALCLFILIPPYLNAQDLTPDQLKPFASALLDKDKKCQEQFKSILQKDDDSEWSDIRIARVCQCQNGLAIAMAFAEKSGKDWLGSKIKDCVEFAKVMEEQ